MPAWTYPQLKAAYVAAGSPAMAAAVATLNAQTVAMTNVVVLWTDMKAVLRAVSTGDWAKIVLRSRMLSVVPPVSAQDFAVMAAINAVQSENTDRFDPTNAQVWTAVQSGINALAAVGDVAPATVTILASLTSKTSPVWEPPVTAGDIQTAGAQP